MKHFFTLYKGLSTNHCKLTDLNMLIRISEVCKGKLLNNSNNVNNKSFEVTKFTILKRGRRFPFNIFTYFIQSFINSEEFSRKMVDPCKNNSDLKEGTIYPLRTEYTYVNGTSAECKQITRDCSLGGNGGREGGKCIRMG